MSPVRLGCAVAALTVGLWQIGALAPFHPRRATGLDLHWYFFTTYEAFFGALRDAAPMLWNPYQLCGQPWIGTLQGAFFYPPHVLYVLLPTPWALALSTVLHLALAAGGAAAFARRAGTSAAGATLAAVVFAYAGWLRSMQLWPYLLEASAWIPFGALAVLDLTEDRPRRGALALAFASGMSWLAGSPQATVFACYAWAALFAARLLVTRPGLARLARACGAVGVALVAGALLGAIALLPAFEYAREGMRRTSTLDVDLMYPFGVYPPRSLWKQWMATGSPAVLLAALALAPLAPASGALALALWGLVVAGAAAAFAVGPATPLFEVYRALPFLGWFRVPERVLADFFVYLLEGSIVSRHFTSPFAGRITTLAAPRGREPPATRRRLLDLAATRFVILPAPMGARADVAAFVRDAGLEPRPALGPGLDLWENPYALPRAYVTYRTRAAPPVRELLSLMAREGFDPLVESFVEGDAGLPVSEGTPPRGTPATIVRDDPHVVEIDATLAAPGLVVLADTYYPGWTATVDGAPAPILPTNHLFRGVPAPAGAHRIRFAYRPRSVALGAALSLLTALALAAGAYRLKARPSA